ncbi:secreted and transmembrane protein 1 isoform X4 [Manis javanica]|uniref:secreted and transmembrane protein 1 isoform X4 n=1 Tax=Manis javanica TaxID=9974 RepID=UPI003C6D53EC
MNRAVTEPAFHRATGKKLWPGHILVETPGRSPTAARCTMPQVPRRSRPSPGESKTEPVTHHCKMTLRECPEHQWSTQDPQGHADLSITPPSSQDALEPPAPGCLPACSERKQESPPHTHPRALVARGTATCFVFGWDDPTCTEGVVTVSRGACAVMSCTISHPLSNVTVCLSAQVPVCLSADGKNQPLVSRKVPGSPADGGWQLRVHGAVAQLVIDGAQDAQAGQYTWYLEGFQRSIRTTTLSVSGAEAQEPEKRRAQPFSPSQDDFVLSKEQGPPVREIRRPARLTTTGRGGRSRERAPPAPFSPTWKPPVAADPAQCVGSISLGVSPHPSWRVALGTHGQAPHAGLCCLSPQGLSLLPRPVAKSVEMSSTGSFGLKDPVPRPPHPTLRPGSFSPGVQPQVQEGAYCPLGDTPGLGARWPWARSSLSLEQEPVWGSVLPAVSGAEMCTHPTTTRGRSPEALWGGGQQVAAGRWWLLCLPTWPLLLPRFPSLHLPRLLALPHLKPIYVARRQINCDYVKLCNSVGCNLNRNKQGFSTFNALKTSIH